MKRVVLALAIAGLAAGCVTRPFHMGEFSPHESEEFAGFSGAVDHFVRIQVKRKDTGQWVTLTELLPELDPYNAGGQSWYGWIGSVKLDTRPEWRCFFTANCTTPRTVLYADFRVIEVGGDYNPLVTRTQEEAECMNPLILDIGLLEAYDQCAEERHHLTLRWDNRYTLGGGGGIAY